MKMMRPLLVLEDSDGDFETVLDAARRTGVAHAVYRARSGEEAVHQLRAQAAQGTQRPALVLMDLNTPNSDGRYALQQMKLDPHLRNIPVVVLSTSNNPRDVDFCYAHGANAFHVKPVQHPAHLAMLKHIFDYWLMQAVLPE